MPANDPTLRDEIYQQLADIRLIDPHTHINPHAPASTTLCDILGYHYYTELAHSAGMPKALIEDADASPRQTVERLVEHLQPLENTAQYSWLISICQMFFGFEDDRLHLNNWEALYDRSEEIMSSAQWPQTVLDQSNVQAVFLTNDFDDDLAGFDSETYIPCLRTDDLVFHLADPAIRGRLESCTGVTLDGSLTSLRESLAQRFDHFTSRGARACAISLPPSFSPSPVSDGRASTAINAVLRDGKMADPSHREALSRRVFWTLAELCDQTGLPFDLMIGVNRGVYADGVHQGRDLYDSRVSLIQYRECFNAFPNVTFPISVLASVTNQELVSHAWIFPNVVTNGHWWYSNTPSFIARDAAARLEAVPQTQQIGYYSDAYRLEFVWPKFDMYRRILSGVLADQFVTDQRWGIDRAIDLGRKVLRDNVEAIFPAVAASSAYDQSMPSLSFNTSESSKIAIADDDSDEFQTQIETLDEDVDTIEHADEFETVELTDLPTVVDEGESTELVASDDTADRQSTDEFSIESPSNDEFATSVIDELETVIVPPKIDATADPIDRLPDAEELELLDIDDVELDELDQAQPHENFEDELDPEPLQIDLDQDDEPAAEIQSLTSDSSFAPDEETLKLDNDPVTGEFVLSPPESSADDAESGDDDVVIDLEELDFEELDVVDEANQAAASPEPIAAEISSDVTSSSDGVERSSDSMTDSDDDD
ncbi:MAG: glucuronate isomerase, partial [Planctomycetota bacterium]